MGNKDTDRKHKATNMNMPVNSDQLSTVQQLAFTAAGAAGSALLGAILARKGYAPKTIAGVIAAIGAAFGGISDSDALRAVAAGAMSGSGAQLVLMLFLEHEDRQKVGSDGATTAASDGHVPAEAEAANANVVPLAPKAVAS
jgi:hypothetical protein